MTPEDIFWRIIVGMAATLSLLGAVGLIVYLSMRVEHHTGLGPGEQWAAIFLIAVITFFFYGVGWVIMGPA